MVRVVEGNNYKLRNDLKGNKNLLRVSGRFYFAGSSSQAGDKITVNV